MLGYFWRPEEVSLQKDRADFADFRPEQKHIFTANLKYQTLLDSVQGRGPVWHFYPCFAIELEGCIVTWDFPNDPAQLYAHYEKCLCRSCRSF